MSNEPAERTYRTKHGTVATMAVERIGKPSARAEQDEQGAEVKDEDRTSMPRVDSRRHNEKHDSRRPNTGYFIRNGGARECTGVHTRATVTGSGELVLTRK